MGDQRTRRSGSGTVLREMSRFLSELEDANAGSPEVALLLRSYRDEARHADNQEKRWRTRYYLVRAIVLLASASITVISGISLPNGSDLALRILVLCFGALITVVTGTLDLFHMLNRWRIYRVMRFRLVSGCMDAAQAPNGRAVATLAARLSLALREFEDNYITQIATEGSPPKEPVDTAGDRDGHDKGAPPTDPQ
jgi:hypothetical protein